MGGKFSRFSRLSAGLRVRPTFFEEKDARAERVPAPRGLVDTMAELANPGVDVSRVHPDVARFFEDTASLELHIVSRWRSPFTIVWWFLRPIMTFLGQFVLPRREGRILTRVFAIDAEKDGRPGARGVIRSYAESGRTMQVAAYATSANGETRFMNAAFPMFGGQLTGLLRLDAIGEDDEGRLAVGVSSRARAGDGAGIWFVLGGVALRLPLEERLDLWAPAMSCAPSPIDLAVLEGTTIVGRHEQRLFGVRLVTHEYWFRPTV